MKVTTLRYLDHAATGPVRPEVVAAMAPYLTERYGNPSSHHTVGEQASAALEDARARIASIVGVRRGDVVFTSGGTEADNLAVKGLALGAMQRRGARHAVTTAIEHEAVLASADHLVRLHGFDVTILPVDSTGLVAAEQLADSLRDDTAVVSVGYANNEVGTVQDLPSLAAVCRGRGIPFHTDAVQAAGWLPLSTTDADALSIAGHKVGAPQGTGALIVRGRLPLEPVLNGGGQERGRRSGTQDVAGAVALATALELAESERVTDAELVTAIRDDFIDRVLHLVPNARLTGHATRRLPGSASFTFAGTSGEAILLELERRGVVTSSGSACAAGSDEPSHVLLALGIAPEIAQTAVRFTFPHGLRGHLDDVAESVAASVRAVQSHG